MANGFHIAKKRLGKKVASLLFGGPIRLTIFFMACLCLLVYGIACLCDLAENCEPYTLTYEIYYGNGVVDRKKVHLQAEYQLMSSQGTNTLSAGIHTLESTTAPIRIVSVRKDSK